MTKLTHNANQIGAVLMGAAALTGVTLAAPAITPAAPVQAATQATTVLGASWSTLASTADGTLASQHFVGSQVTATVSGTHQTLATITLAAGDFSVIDDDTVAGTYYANLTAQGQSNLAAAVKAAIGDNNYVVSSSIQGALAVNPAGTGTAVMTYGYVDGNQVIATIQQQLGLQSAGTYIAQPPAGYALAAGQSDQILFNMTSRMMTATIQVTAQQTSSCADSSQSSGASAADSSAASVAQSIAASKAASEAAESAAISEANSIAESKAASEAAESAAISEANSIAESEAAESAAVSEANSIAESKAASEAAESAAISEANSIAASRAASEAAESAAVSEANSIAESKAASEAAESASISEANSIAQSKAASEASQSAAISEANSIA
ncbi:MBG domain-containing protein [Lacticaseibacillus sp. 53-4]|nr:MBG domain-containing protein [Lacticaseibacillus sp. 53-4]